MASLRSGPTATKAEFQYKYSQVYIDGDAAAKL